MSALSGTAYAALARTRIVEARRAASQHGAIVNTCGSVEFSRSVGRWRLG
jgi:hypothetical protein